MDKKQSSFGRVKILAAILIVVILIIIAVTGVWLYGRRKRRFREFLAQLDNNTDWEYEQLDDGPPSMTQSRQAITPIFSMLAHNESLNRRSIIQNSSSNNDINLMHTLTDVSRNSQNTLNNSLNNVNSANNNRNVNERTPITVMT